MIRKEKITELLRGLSRYGSSQNGLDLQCRMLRQILQSYLPTEKHEHRTAVLIFSGLKCLDQHDWLQIQCGRVREEIESLIQLAHATADDAHREKLIIELMVKINLLAHAQFIGQELYSRASGFMLQVSTYMLSRISCGDEGNQPTVAPNGTVSTQLRLLRSVVDSVVGELTLCSKKASTAFFVPENQTLEAQVQWRTLGAIVEFGNMVIEQAVSLADLAINTMIIIGDLPPKDATFRKQWLSAYALTAATVAGACNSMVRDAFLTYGNIAELERQVPQGQPGPDDGPIPGPAGPRDN